MSDFSGFPSRPDYVAIPRVFFSDVLPRITDMAELHVTLHLFRLLGMKRGYPRAISVGELLQDGPLTGALCGPGRTAGAEIARGIEAALGRGTFIQAGSTEDEAWLLLNTAQDRKAAEAIRSKQIALPQPSGAARTAVPLGRQERDIFTLYEESIGMLSPLVAERLQEAEAEFPAEWIREAFQIAVEQNHRQWRYVERILERWKTEGKDDGTHGGHSQTSRDVTKYYVWPNRRQPSG